MILLARTVKVLSDCADAQAELGFRCSYMPCKTRLRMARAL